MNLEHTVMDNKKKISIQPERMVVYLQSKIIESTDQEGYMYYLFFYKDHYITAVKTNKVRRRSYVEKANKRGIVFSASHPFCQKLLSNHSSFIKRSFNQVRAKLEKQYPPHETASILTFFDAFIPKKEIFTIIQSYFYQYRRNGQLFAGYRLLRVLLDFTPKHRWVRQTANELQYARYKELYQEKHNDLWEKDINYVEKALFQQRQKSSKAADQLLTLFDHDNRFLDACILMIQQFLLKPSQYSYERIMERIKTHFSSEDMLIIVEDMYQRLPSFEPLQYTLLHHYLLQQNLDKTIPLLNEHSLQLTNTQWMDLENMLEKMNIQHDNMSIEHLNTYIAALFQTDPKKAETILHKCVTQLLTVKKLADVSDWLRPIQSAYANSPVIKRIENMLQWSEDPDQQRKLGELYYQFQQIDQAIECFSWEMEMDTQDPLPVRWLSKLYLEAGKQEESKAYQKLYQEMQKQKNA
ncbi:hypothetical protein SAMN05192534_10535 [Alteribacillus persepolensis]|uniref:Tetratricopeptide repeat-containing protein n=1 Tax=Alteribacillus persepolensis TaxID=568899 RepID=A0A1G8C1X8_9BACI|nr:hypothetical protein [Alteribacillus persepolensis]SDH39487.1 hypothetical protein SAMN05192534_10535 [Alteribacillus persepolensis]